MAKPAQPKEGSWQDLLALTNGDRATWKWADPESLLDAVVNVTADGAAVLLSVTSDGGALVLQVWHQKSRIKTYPTSSAQLNEHLAALAGRPGARD